MRYQANSEQVYDPNALCSWDGGDEVGQIVAHGIVDQWGRGGFMQQRYGSHRGEALLVAPVLALPATCEGGEYGEEVFATCKTCGNFRECEESGIRYYMGGSMEICPLYECRRCRRIGYVNYTMRHNGLNDHYDWSVIPLGPGAEWITGAAMQVREGYWLALENVRIAYELNLQPARLSPVTDPWGDDRTDPAADWRKIEANAKLALAAIEAARNLVELERDWADYGAEAPYEVDAEAVAALNADFAGAMREPYPFDVTPVREYPAHQLRDASYGSLHGNGCGCSACDFDPDYYPNGLHAGMTWAEAVGFDEYGLVPAGA